MKNGCYKEYNENGNIDYEYYYLDNLIHREDGPARIFYSENGEIIYGDFWLNGKRIKKKKRKIGFIKEKNYL